LSVLEAVVLPGSGPKRQDERGAGETISAAVRTENTVSFGQGKEATAAIESAHPSLLPLTAINTLMSKITLFPGRRRSRLLPGANGPDQIRPGRHIPDKSRERAV